MLGPRSRKRGAGGSEVAFRRVASFGGRGAALIRFGTTHFRCFQRRRGSSSASICIRPRSLMLGAVAKLLGLLGEAGAFLFRSTKLSAGRVQRGFSNAPLRPH